MTRTDCVEQIQELVATSAEAGQPLYLVAVARLPDDIGAPSSRSPETPDWDLFTAEDEATATESAGRSDPLGAHRLLIRVDCPADGTPFLSVEGQVSWEPVFSSRIDTAHLPWSRSRQPDDPDEVRSISLQRFHNELEEALGRIEQTLVDVPDRVTRFVQRMRKDFGDPGDDPALEVAASDTARANLSSWLSGDDTRYMIFVGMGCSGDSSARSAPGASRSS